MLSFHCTQCGVCCRHLKAFGDLYADLDDGSGVCRFYEAASRRCLRYEDRPLKCRVPEGYALFQDVMTPEEYLAKTKQGCVWLRQLP